MSHAAPSASKSGTAPRRTASRHAAGRARTARAATSGLAIIPLHLLLLTAIALGCVGMAGALSGLWWVLPALGTVAVVLVVTAAARWVGLPSPVVTVAGLAALLLALTVTHLADHALLGFIPTQETFTAMGGLWAQSGDFVSRQSAPYAQDAGLAFVLSALAGLVAVFMETALLGLRLAGLACAGVLALLVVPALTLPGSVTAWGVAAAVVAALALLAGSRVWGAARQRRIAPAPGGVPRAALVLAGVLAVTLLVPRVIPGFYSGVFPQGSSLGSERAAGVGPLRAVGQDLRATERTPRFSYTTSDGNPRYMRLTTLSDFAQDEFFPQTDRLEDGLAGIADSEKNPVPRDSSVTTKVTFETYDEHWLPAPYAPFRFEGLGEDGWSWNPRDLSVYSASSHMSGGSFTVTSAESTATAESLRAAASSSGDDALADYLRIPADVPESIPTEARELTRDATTDYDRALALQNGLRRDFHYDVNAPLAQGYDAGGMAGVEKFMETRAGHAGHFAPVMALMAREMGIPARVAVGYLPNESTRDSNGSERFEVNTGDAHAWPELYFQGAGWVRFEPTPGVASTPEYAPDATEPGDAANPSGSPTATPSAQSSQPDPGTQPPGDQTQPPAPDTPEPQDTQDDSSPWSVPLWQALTGAGVLLLLVLAALPRVIRGRRRRARLADMANDSLSPPARANAAWDELADLSVDHGGAPRESDTPRVRARRMAAGIPAANDAVTRIIADVEHASYAAPDDSWKPAASAADLGKVHDELMHRATPAQRFRATWLPGSVFRR